MSKLKEKELLEYLDRHLPHWAKGDERAVAIREMIQKKAEQEEIEACYIDIVLDLYEQLEKKKPGVTEEWIERWNQVIAERVNVQMKKDFIREEISLVYPGTENLAQMLTEAGVKVVEK